KAEIRNGEKLLAGPEQMALVTGPVEHLFLSANVAVKTVREIKLDEKTGLLGPRDKPARPLLGLNWMWGDVQQDGRNFPGVGPLSLGVILELSDQPARSFGVMGGYRIRAFKNASAID